MGLYDLVLVEPGPLPPHERTWRHPSELGPTHVEADPGSHHHLAALGVGTLAVLAVAAMVIAITPRSSTGPIAVSATTAPSTSPLVREPVAATAGVSSRSVSAARIPVAALLTSVAAFPHAITSGPQLTIDGTDIADDLPGDDEMVFVRTEAVTYELRWDQVPSMASPDGTVIFDSDGDLLAHVSAGRMIILVDD